MSYVWLGIGLSLILAIGTIIFSAPPALEYKTIRPSSSRRSRDEDDGPTENCPICQDEMRRSQREFLPCFHAFHSECLLELLRRCKHCPVCRTKIL